MRAYLDHNATSPLRPQARDAMLDALDRGGNPSAVYAEGRAARSGVERARGLLGDALGARPQSVVFTSGGTEAANLALLGGLAASGARRVLISAVEHDAVDAAARASGVPVEIMPVDSRGVLDLAALDARLADWDDAEGPPFVAVMAANNETGVIQPIAEAARLVRAAGGFLMVDAVQALGRTLIDLTVSGAHYIAVSAHKIGGPPGVGALVFADDAPVARRVHGGGQERGHRAGTENAPAIAGFAAALAPALSEADHWAAVARWRDALERDVLAQSPETIIAGREAPRLPNTTCLIPPGPSAETALIGFDLAGIALSSGSACSSGKVAPSRVLQAMDLPADRVKNALRVSFGWSSREDDAHRFQSAWGSVIARARAATALNPSPRPLERSS